VISLCRTSLKINCAKSFCIAFGQTYDTPFSYMKLGNNMIGWSTSIKYLGLSLVSDRSVSVDDSLIRRKFYASCNAILSNSVGQSELNQVVSIRNTLPANFDLLHCGN